jgi:ParB family chromosome partitioning protein
VKKLKIPIDRIVVSKDNPRQSFDEEGLRRLGESIKEHGQLQAVIVRPRGSQYELVVGERRLRACALVGINEIEAEVRDVDDATCMELRLIENTQREDLTDAEKGDAVLSLWANYEKYETITGVAKAINVPFETVRVWTAKSRRLSDKVKKQVGFESLSDLHTKYLLKYPHSIQEKLASAIIKYKLTVRDFRQFYKFYDTNPNANLEELANKVKGIKTVTVPKDKIPPEILEKINEEKTQLAKVQRIRKKPSKPITKEQVRKKTDFKFEKVRVSMGTKGLEHPLKREIKPLAIPLEKSPDYSLCQCAMCPLFGKHCKGRCWT